MAALVEAKSVTRAAKPDALTLTLHYLPDTSYTGGNARDGHWAQRHKAMRTEKKNWAWELCLVMNSLPRWPKYQHLVVKVTVIYLTRRRRDPDNVGAALKPLWDTLVNLGIVPDDDAEHLTIEPPVLLVDKTRGPVTVLELAGD